MEDEKDNEKPWREDRQRYQTRHAQALFIRREDQDLVGWAARGGQAETEPQPQEGEAETRF